MTLNSQIHRKQWVVKSWPSFLQMARIRHGLLQSAESIQGLEVIISVAHALVHSAFCYETKAYLIIIRLPFQLPSIEAAFKVIYLKYSKH